MLVKSVRVVLFFIISVGLLSCGNFSVHTQTQPLTEQTNPQVNAVAVLATGTLYTQPVNPNGILYLSAWLDPDGSDFDQKVWDNFTLPASETITDIEWIGAYDPARSGMGGPVLDFTVAIYPSIAAGTEPAVANPPLVTYQTGGNAGETSIGTIGGIPMNAYAFNLPTPFVASAGVKYWVYIVASQGGSSPDWCFAAGTGWDSSHYRWGAGAGGDSGFRTVPGDVAFILLGPVSETATPTNTATETMTEIPTNTATDTATPTSTDTPTNTPTFTSTNTATDTPTDIATYTPTNTPTYTPTNIPAMIFLSSDVYDGWILESSEASNTGGIRNATQSTLRLGDDAANKQYRAILSFDTSTLPVGATITSVTLKFKYAGKTGTLPFNTHGSLLADIKNGSFKDNPLLQLGDFNALPGKKAVFSFNKTIVNGWYSKTITNPLDLIYINRLGITQFRLRFSKDDNNDFGADFLKIYSGNAIDVANRPQLIIEYYMP